LEYFQCIPGSPGLKGTKGEPGRDGYNGNNGIAGPPGHIFMIPLQSQTTKGPDNAEALRAMLSQHMVRHFNQYSIDLL